MISPGFSDTATVMNLLHPRELETHQTKGQLPEWTNLPAAPRVAYIALTFIPLFITIFLFWRRCCRLNLKTLHHMTYIRILVLLSYILAICFSISSFSFVLHGIRSLALCRNSIYVCIGFLFAGKFAMQLFLIERAHVANINYLRRRDDPIWWLGMGTMGISVLALTIWTFVNPVYFMSERDGRCRKGLPPNVVAPIQAYEVVLNLVLTALFIRMLQRSKRQVLFPSEFKSFYDLDRSVKTVIGRVRSSFSSKGSKRTSECDNTATPVATEITNPRAAYACSGLGSGRLDYMGPLASNYGYDANIVLPPSTRPSRLRRLAHKSLIGTLLMLMWSITNNVIFYSTRGRENAWLCFLQCNFDVTLSVFVLHWLTADPRDDQRAATRETRSSVTALPMFSDHPSSSSLREISSDKILDTTRGHHFEEDGIRKLVQVKHDIVQVPLAIALRAFDSRRGSAVAATPPPPPSHPLPLPPPPSASFSSQLPLTDKSRKTSLASSQGAVSPLDTSGGGGGGGRRTSFFAPPPPPPLPYQVRKWSLPSINTSQGGAGSNSDNRRTSSFGAGAGAAASSFSSSPSSSSSASSASSSLSPTNLPLPPIPATPLGR